MAKCTCFLALLLVIVVCAEAIRIDPARPSGRREISNIKKADPKCKKDGMFVDPIDCTKYLKCVNGTSRKMKCPEGFKFDSHRHCVQSNDNPNCGKESSAPPGVDFKCKTDGKFPFDSDCHKYIVCIDRVPKLVTCPEKQFFSFVNFGCIRSKKCPQQRSDSEADIVCKKNGQYIAYKNDCRKYYVCENLKPIQKTCPPGKAVDIKKKNCTVEMRRKCKSSNDIRHVEPDE